MDDAQRAADALVGAGVRQVWLYGSLARGEVDGFSDIDLVAVLDDVDYGKRHHVRRSLDEVARAAAERPHVEVMVTDLPEWRIQREQATNSFVGAISCDLQLLASTPFDPDLVDWSKEQVLPSTNDELSLWRMKSVMLNLSKIPDLLEPGSNERELQLEDDTADYILIRGGRFVQLCEAADMTVENALKGIGVVQDIEQSELYSHKIGVVVSALERPDREYLLELMGVDPDVIKTTDYIGMWRTRGAYMTPTEGMTAIEVASAAFCTAIVSISCDVAIYAAERLTERLGECKEISDVLRWSARIRDHLDSVDLVTGEALDVPWR